MLSYIFKTRLRTYHTIAYSNDICICRYKDSYFNLINVYKRIQNLSPNWESVMRSSHDLSQESLFLAHVEYWPHCKELRSKWKHLLQSSSKWTNTTFSLSYKREHKVHKSEEKNVHFFENISRGWCKHLFNFYI